MSGGKADVKATNPPPDPKPDAPPIIQLLSPNKQAEGKPKQQQHCSGLQEHSLRLCKLFDGLKLLESSRKVYIVIYARLDQQVLIGLEKDAALIWESEVAG